MMTKHENIPWGGVQIADLNPPPCVKLWPNPRVFGKSRFLFVKTFEKSRFFHFMAVKKVNNV